MTNYVVDSKIDINNVLDINGTCVSRGNDLASEVKSSSTFYSLKVFKFSGRREYGQS